MSHPVSGFPRCTRRSSHLERVLPFLAATVMPLWAGDAAGPGASLAAPALVQSATLVASPLVRRTAGGPRSVIDVTLHSAALSRVNLRLLAEGWTEPPTVTRPTMAEGTNEVRFEVPWMRGPATVRLRVQAAEGEVELGPFELEQPRSWTVYLTQHTHTDIGYTRPQTEILPEHLRYIDYALEYCDLTEDYPDDAKFRWTCETSWAVREYVKRRPAGQVARLKRRIQEGRIEVAGMLLNMSEIASENSLAALLQPLRMLRDEIGVPVRTAMQNDVNGAGWCLPDYFEGAGIKYLTMGINQTRSILPFDQPTAFWWESPSGKRVLAYRSDHYMTGNFWKINAGKLDGFEPEVLRYLRSLEDRRYPFDRVGVQFSGYFTDNSPPSTVGCDLVKAWNTTYLWPRLRLSTAREFLAWVEENHGLELGVYRQAWPDWWTDGFGSAARETAAARATEAELQVSEGLLTMGVLLGAEIRPAVAGRIAAIQDDLLFYAEHTFGAAESIDDPLAENTQVQWGEKSSYVWDAVKESNLLREEALGLVQEFLPRQPVPTIAVFNTLNFDRSGLVRLFIDHEILPADREFRIVDAQSGTPAPVQALQSRSDGTYWALWADHIPPLGYRLFRIEVAKEKRGPAAAALSDTGLDNRFYALQVDPARGAVRSLVDKDTGEELVDREDRWGFAQCLYETLSGGREMKPDQFHRSSLRNIQVQPGAGGPVWQSLLISGDMDGCASNHGVRLEIRLYDTEKRVEFHFALRKLPVRHPEAVYVAFPFRGSANAIQYEGQGGLVTPGAGQLPGSSSDWQTVQSFLRVNRGDGQVIWGCAEAPLVQLGDFNLGKWQPVTRVDQPRVYSWVMNNYWFTNFRAEQEGEFKWVYYLTSTRQTNAVVAAQFGWSSRVPLASRVLPPAHGSSGDRPPTLSTLALDAPNLLLVEARPAREDRAVTLHLREADGQSARLTRTDVTSSAVLRGADEVNVLEDVREASIGSLSFTPWETRFVVLKFR